MRKLVNDKVSASNSDKKEVVKRISTVRDKFIENNKDLKLKRKIK